MASKEDSKSSMDIDLFERDLKDYGEVVEESWTKIVRFCTHDDSKIIKSHDNDACWIPTKGEGQYNLEVNKDGYPRLRFLKSKEQPTEKSYMRGSKSGVGKQATRKVYPKGGMYVHHLAYVKKAGVGRIRRLATFRGADGTVTEDVCLTVSHLCGRNACVNPDHLVLEPHALNLSRNSCCSEFCAHSVKCIQSAATKGERVSALEAKFTTMM